MRITAEQLPGVPEGYEAVKLGYPQRGDGFVNPDGVVVVWERQSKATFQTLIIRKIEQPPEYVPYTLDTMPIEGVLALSNGNRVVVRPFNDVTVCVGSEYRYYESVFVNLTHLDGTPFGTLKTNAATTTASESEETK